MNQQPRWQHTLWQEAARAGLSTFISCLLLSAITVLPYLAQSHDFAHSHPDGTAPHLHELDAMLVLAPALPALALTLQPVRYAAWCFHHDDVELARFHSPQQSRAPPVLS